MRLVLLLLAIALLGFGVLYVAPAFRGQQPVAAEFSVGPWQISFYGLLLATAILTAFLVARREAQRTHFAASAIEGALPWVVGFGFLGARLYYVVFSWQYYRADWLGVFKVWEGGLAIYGAILGGVLGLWWYASRQGLHFPKLLDVLAVVAPLGQAVGRWGNFFNQEAFGLPTGLPWKMYVAPASRPFAYLNEKFFHPTFLYESLWDLFVFLLLLRLYRKGPPAGSVAGSYLVLYGLGRFFIEGLRLDSFFLNNLRLDQLSSLLAVLLGAVLLWRSYGQTPVENP